MWHWRLSEQRSARDDKADIMATIGFQCSHDVIKWKHFPRYRPLVRGIRGSPVNSPHKGQWRRALMFSLICAWTNGWANHWDAGDSIRHHSLWRHCNDTHMIHGVAGSCVVLYLLFVIYCDLNPIYKINIIFDLGFVSAILHEDDICLSQA